MEASGLTIAKAAEAAGVGVESVRYYERRGLVPQPAQRRGAFRTYDSNHVARIRFIKRAQALGFTLEEVESLLKLQDGTDRAAIQTITAARLSQIRERLRDLRRMEQALAELLDHCRTGVDARCPIIEAIADPRGASPAPGRRKKRRVR